MSSWKRKKTTPMAAPLGPGCLPLKMHIHIISHLQQVWKATKPTETQWLRTPYFRDLGELGLGVVMTSRPS